MTKLKETREAKGLTQLELAVRSGVSMRTLQAYEQGYKDINKAQVVTALKLAETLNCDVREIIER